jgi:homoaconitase/3-isopropylmalate dehydratase large subunit
MIDKTLGDKLWDAHVVHHDDGGAAPLCWTADVVHAVASPAAFEGLRVGSRARALAARGESGPPRSQSARQPSAAAPARDPLVVRRGFPHWISNFNER